ncbi:hypothetical protein CCAX7_22350 [Capsulimonas corticalis]|uniref:Uncharacterized protein n=1 Tax=Capsulimonas corticalis TaxID=2219043 RepID=A0A402D262_9BACT|nr:hypothetical protein [Capsulimonas corticalis]BDI30184.1 hypothetical protein CCAX7_22350 [Capsulimonas corticalis]
MPYQGQTALIVSLISICFVIALWVIGVRFEKEQLSKNRDDHH